MEWGSENAAAMALAVWLLGLSLAGLALWARVRRLESELAAQDGLLQEIRADLAGLRADLAGVARAQQVADLRRDLLEAVEVRLASRGRRGQAGVAFAGPATITGAVAGGDVGTFQPQE